MSDEGFHEIQLNGKQLVFLFMATTVVVVVIFLCGVLVGRGARGERFAAPGETGVMASTDVMPDQRADKGAAAAVPEPATATPPAPADENLSYFDRLDGNKAPAENLKSPSAAPSKPSAGSKAPAARPDDGKPAARPAPEKPADKPVATVADAKPTSLPAARAAAGEPGGEGFAVQIAALSEKSEADTIVKRLSDKGYQAYVLAPSSKAAPVYRVRVGKFKSRRDAELVASKLEKEEQFKPWVIR